MSDDDDFQIQLIQEAEEKRRLAAVKTRIDPDDGTVFEWDEEKKAWFPKVDEDFIAQYQMTYGNDPEAELYRKRQQEWADYYASLQKPKEDGDSSTAENSEEMMNEYYNSKEYREWYEKYMTTPKEEKKEETPAAEEPPPAPSEDHEKKRKKASRPAPAWYQMEDNRNTHVYVRGLPLNITEEEFEEIMKKCGMIMHEPFSNHKRMKLYRDDEGNLQGDGRCCYIKVESVDLALKIIDGMEYKGHTIHVERAKFELKGDFDPGKRRRLTQKEKKKLKEHEENLFRWGPDGNRFVRAKREKTIILKHVFTLEDIMADPMNVLAIREKIQSECSRCGVVRKVTIFENNPDGVVKVMFATPEEADVALTYLNGRVLLFGDTSKSSKLTLDVSVWDGKTNYDIEESEEMKALRLARWNAFIQEDELPNNSDSICISPALTVATESSDLCQQQSSTEVMDAGAETPPEIGQSSPVSDS